MIGYGATRAVSDLIDPPTFKTDNLRLFAYRIADSHHLDSIGLRSLLADWKNSETHYWLNVEWSNAADLSLLLDHLGVSSDLQSRCVAGEHMPCLIPGDDLVYIDFAITTDTQDRTEFLTLICFPNLLISVHTGRLPQLRKLANLLERHLRLECKNKSALLFRILGQFHLENLTLVFQTRDRIAEVTRLMDESPEEIDSSDLLRLKREITQHGTTSEDQLFCLSILKDLKSAVFRYGEELTSFHDVNEFNFEFPLKLLNRMETRLTELHHNYQLYLQEKSNGRLKILTILSAVFLPLTLLAGIYGMNFESMPELGSPYGYPSVLCAMVGITVGMIYFFRRFGWFK